jgi:hypothetical protein
MMITIYNNNNKDKYISHHFSAKELDKIKEFLYNERIKWYTISYSEQEKLEYEQLSKRHN